MAKYSASASSPRGVKTARVISEENPAESGGWLPARRRHPQELGVVGAAPEHYGRRVVVFVARRLAGVGADLSPAHRADASQLAVDPHAFATEKRPIRTASADTCPMVAYRRDISTAARGKVSRRPTGATDVAPVSVRSAVRAPPVLKSVSPDASVRTRSVSGAR